MPNFDFNNIDLSSRADVRKIQENFEEIEEKAITNSGLETALTNYIDKSEDNFEFKSNNNSYRNYEIVIFRSGNLVAIRLFYQIKPRVITAEDIYNGKYDIGGTSDWYIPNLNYLKVRDGIPQIRFAKVTDSENASANITTYIEVTPYKDWDDPDPEPEEPNKARWNADITLNGAESVTLSMTKTVELFAHYIVK